MKLESFITGAALTGRVHSRERENDFLGKLEEFLSYIVS